MLSILKSLFRRPVLKPEIALFYQLISNEEPERFQPEEFDPLFLANALHEKRYQNRVFFPYFGIPTPYTVKSTDFHDEFYPLFLKSSMETYFIKTSEELELHRKQASFKYSIIQQYIKPSTEMASHIRLVVSSFDMPAEERVRGAVVLYSKDINEHRSNHCHGGKPIALTGKGSLAEITEKEIRILKDMDIDPFDRKIPSSIIDLIYRPDEQNNKPSDFFRLFASSEVGIDITYGRPYSFGQYLEEKPAWYFLEINEGPDNKFIHESGAWIETKFR